MARLEIDIDWDDVYDDLASWEKQLLCNQLYEDGYDPQRSEPDSIDAVLADLAERSPRGEEFAARIRALVEGYDALSPEQLAALMSL